MQKRKLGSGGLEVSAIGLGCMGLSSGYGPATDKAGAISAHPRGRRARRHVLRHRRSLWPVQQRGSRGRSPGAVPRPGRDRHQVRLRFDPRRPSRSASTAGRSISRQVAEASLKRLRTDRIDLFYQHRVDPDVPIEDVAARSRT